MGGIKGRSASESNWVGVLLAIILLTISLGIISAAYIQMSRPTPEEIIQRKECIKDQIQIARQNWDIGAEGNQDEDEYWKVEFQEQDQLADFIEEVCLGVYREER